jgi:hypothetical protein
MPLTLVALSKVDDKDAGLASSLVSTGRMTGGSIGLAILGTVAWSVVANTAGARRTHADQRALPGCMLIAVQHDYASQSQPFRSGGSPAMSRSCLLIVGCLLLGADNERFQAIGLISGAGRFTDGEIKFGVHRGTTGGNCSQSAGRASGNPM